MYIYNYIKLQQGEVVHRSNSTPREVLEGKPFHQLPHISKARPSSTVIKLIDFGPFEVQQVEGWAAFCRES